MPKTFAVNRGSGVAAVNTGNSVETENVVRFGSREDCARAISHELENVTTPIN